MTFHPSINNWSNLYLGKVARTQTIQNIEKATLAANHNHSGIVRNTFKFIGGIHPPKNNIVVE